MKRITLFHQGNETTHCYIENEMEKPSTHLLNFLCRAAMSLAYNLQFEIQKDVAERVWRVTVKERKSANPIITTHSGQLDKAGIIDFFGLHNSDVEWYRIEEIIQIEEHENVKS